MKRLWLIAALAVAMVVGLQAEGMGQGMHHGMGHGKMMPKNFRMVPMDKAQILQKGEAKMFCPKCGMTLPMFYRTNHAAKVNGKMEQFCSIHCLVEEMKSGKKVTDVQVVDNSTLKFIPAEKAWYVVGSSKPATMSKVSKYAFGTKEAAEKFAKEYGGKVMPYAEVLKMVEANFDKEAAMIAKRQAMMAKKGEQIYKKMCKPIEKKFATAAEAKAYIKANNLCGGLKGKPLQAVALYLKSIGQ
ncbi:nitrous oxide reductase accessory protein NosL [Nitratifractor sp.]